MYIGKRIASIRNQNGLTQDFVCNGILSRTHLSNIESGRFNPKSDTLELLADRLSVPESYLVNYEEDDEALENELKHLHKLIFKDINKAQELVDVIDKQYLYINSLNQELTYHILKTICFFKANKHKMAVHYFSLYLRDKAHLIESNFKAFYGYFLYCEGMFSYLSNEPAKAVEFFLIATKKMNDKHLIADCFFNIAICKKIQFKYFIANDFIKKATQIYIDIRSWEKVAKADLAHGVIEWQLEQFEKSRELLEKSLQYFEKVDDKASKMLTMYNLGLTYRSLKLYKESLNCFSESLTYYESINDPTKDHIYRALLNTYITIGDEQKFNELLKWVQKNCETLLMKAHLSVIKARYSMTKGEAIDTVELEDAFKTFLDEEQWEDISDCSYILAKHYFSIKYYKKASIFFNEAYKAVEKLK